MSREGMFDGLEDIPFDKPEHHYEPGSLGFDISLVNTLMDYYLEGGFDRLYSCYWGVPNRKSAISTKKRTIRGIEGIIENCTKDRFEASTLIDTMLTQLTSRLPPSDITVNVAMMLDSLVQALYNLGHNDFKVDLRDLQKKKAGLTMLARNLIGTEDRKLRATYMGDAIVFGSDSMHCNLELFGVTYTGANRARNSSLTYHGSVNHLGGHPKNCTFHLDTTRPIVYSDDCQNNAYHVNLGETRLFGLLKGLYRGFKLSRLRKKGFFEQGNTIIFHRGDKIQEVSK